MQLPLDFLLPHHRAFVERFAAACEQDARVVAAFLGGSYATGAADAYSDLDLCVIVTDAALDDFIAHKDSFVQQLGDPAFLEDFDRQDNLFFIFPDDTEGELNIASMGGLSALGAGAFIPLLDKASALAGAAFPFRAPARQAQIETLRREVVWFWHEMSHFITAMRRGQLWWAQGQLEALRRMCVNLARLRRNFADPDVGDEAYWKIDRAMPTGDLSPLQSTFGPMEPGAMLAAARALVAHYRVLAPPLAREHGLAYPSELERVMMARFDSLGVSSMNG